MKTQRTSETTVTVTELMRRGRKCWRLRTRIGGVVRRRFFEEYGDALVARDLVLDQLERRGTESFEGVGGMTVAEGWREFERLRLPALRGSHARLVEWWLGVFVERHGRVDLAGVTPRMIDGFLANDGWSGTTRAQGYIYLRLFFNWLVRYDYLERSPVGRAEVPRRTTMHHLLRVKDVERLLELTDNNDRMRAWLVLGVFGGMRQSEVARARPEDVEEDEVVVPRTKSTEAVARRRYVPILPALRRHLPARWDCLDENYVKRQRTELAVRLGWGEWPQNCLRHTAASMHLAMWQDAGKTAFFLGHSSPQMVHKTYARAVRRRDAERFWGL